MRLKSANQHVRFSWLGKGLLVLALSISVLQGTPARGAKNQGMNQAVVVAGGKEIRVDIADSDALRAMGLGGRKGLGPNEGMLFVYASPGRYGFWMKRMVFSIDIVWLHNNQVVYVASRVPFQPPGTPDGDLPTYAPDAEANFVLELAAGQAERLGLRPGSRVEYRW
ncbi:MAG: DUF192 domain-containing protein [Deltaproteobacteria bacterium]|nr:DUF192 domain-containing protein [Deltaproteobacteria bacterium]